MKILYFNELHHLPNFGCRSTGAALSEMLSVQHEVITRDGLETVLHSGWDAFAPGTLRLGGLLPRAWFDRVWKQRQAKPRTYRFYSALDRMLGARHDVIGATPKDSVQILRRHAKTDPYCKKLLKAVRSCDAIAINGEGTLIFGNPTMRDALFALFIMELGHQEGKPVHLLNAMVTSCPYTGAGPEILDIARETLATCATIVCRESESQAYVNTLLKADRAKLIPDALFSWGNKFRQAADAVKLGPGLCLPFGRWKDRGELRFDRPYICLSGSSSAWRFGGRAATQMAALAQELLKTGLAVYFVETCAGDSYLSKAGSKAGLPVVPYTVPVLAGGGILAGASIYVTGRYHPAIMAGAGGVPTVFMSSNSHKTKTVQTLLGYENPMEFPVCPEGDDLVRIREAVETLLANRAAHAERIRTAHVRQEKFAAEYLTLLD